MFLPRVPGLVVAHEVAEQERESLPFLVAEPHERVELKPPRVLQRLQKLLVIQLPHVQLGEVAHPLVAAQLHRKRGLGHGAQLLALDTRLGELG